MGHAWKAMAFMMKGRFRRPSPRRNAPYEIDPNPGMQIFLAWCKRPRAIRPKPRNWSTRSKNVAQQQYVCNYEISQVYAVLGDRDQAMKWLKSGVEQQCDCMIWLQGEPWMDSLRADPRYLDLIKRVGFDRMPKPAAR